jgi:hypothetical protein
MIGYRSSGLRDLRELREGLIVLRSYEIYLIIVAPANGLALSCDVTNFQYAPREVSSR